MSANEPPYLTVGTDVSARYKGAFCEAKVKKVNRLVKCKVVFENSLGTMVLPDDQLRGTLRLNSYVEARHPEKNQFFSAVVNKIFDYSQYTVVFDDGDETTLRRTSLCLKSGRHFAESETLDRLPLTNPEHFGTPVLGSKSKRQRRSAPSCSSIDDESSSEGFSPKAKKKFVKKDQESDIAKVVCVEIGDKRKKDSWFPALVVSPSSQELKISLKDQYLVRSFKDGKYYPVKKKEARMFTKEIGSRVESSVLKIAVDKAMQYLNKDEIPPHWDWDLMMGHDLHSDADEIKDSEVESSDDEPSEEKDRFVAQLYKFMDERGTPINRAPTITGRDLNLYKLFSIVQQMGGYNRVTNQNKWRTVYTKMGLTMSNPACSMQIKKAYKRYLHSFEDFNRKLGCTMVCNTRSGHVRHRSDRSIIMTRKREQNMPLPRSRIAKDVKKTQQEKPKTEETPERVIRSRSLAKAEEVEQNKQKEAIKSPSSEPKLEKMETRGSTKIEQEKCKEIKSSPTKEKEKKKIIIKVKEEKNKDKTPKSNGKEAEKEKITTIPKVKLEDDKEQQPKAKVGKTDDKEAAEKLVRSAESDAKSKRTEANVRVGDRVKVKYGRGKQHKMYEAKVLKIERENGEKKFFVHYTGWNVRYDEWIKKGRIIEVVDSKSPIAKNPKRSHSWQDSKALLKRSMLFASPRKRCNSSPKISSSIALRTRRQDSTPELTSNNLEPRKLRRQFSEEPHISDNSEMPLLSKNNSETSVESLPPMGERETGDLNVQKSIIKEEEISEAEEDITDKESEDLKDDDSWDMKETISKNDEEQISAIEKTIKKEVDNDDESLEPLKSTDVVLLKVCTVNLLQENRNTVFSSDTEFAVEDSSNCVDTEILEAESLEAQSEVFPSNQNSELSETNSRVEDGCVEKIDNDKEDSLNKALVFSPYSNLDDVENKVTSNRENIDCSTKNRTDSIEESENKLKTEDKQSQDAVADTNEHNELFLSEIAEQLVDLNKTIPDHAFSDEDLPPTLDIKPDLISADGEREIYETQPELRRAISEVEVPNESYVTQQNIALYHNVYNKPSFEVSQYNSDSTSQELEQNDLWAFSGPKNPSDLTDNASDKEKSTSEITDEIDDSVVCKKEKKNKTKFVKDEVDNTNVDKINENDDSTKNKDSKVPAKKKPDSCHESSEAKKKSKKLKDKKKKLKKHKNLKGAEEKYGSKESQDGDASKKEKKKRDDKIDLTIASVLGQKKGESSKKLKKYRKNKDKNSPKKNDLLMEKKMKRKKKKKDLVSLEADEKSSNDQTTSDSDKAVKPKKGKKRDKKKSKKKTGDSLELLNRTLEEEIVDIPKEKSSIANSEDKNELDNPNTTLESNEKLTEDISFLLCQENVPASPLGNEPIERDTDSFALLDLEQNEIPIQQDVESSSCAEHSANNKLPSIQPENFHGIINKRTCEMLTVLDNTPPTTPESVGTFLTNSPSYDHDMSSPVSTSPHKNIPEAENDSLQETNHLDIMESEDSLTQTESAILFLANQAVSRRRVSNFKSVGLLKRPLEGCESLPPRKKRATKFYSADSMSAHSSKPKSPSKSYKGESKDFDASSAATNSDSISSVTSCSQPVRISKFKFDVPLDDSLDSEKRIVVIQERLSELKKTYMALKAEVAMIDRHRKKAKRKEKESVSVAASNMANVFAQEENANAS